VQIIQKRQLPKGPNRLVGGPGNLFSNRSHDDGWRTLPAWLAYGLRLGTAFVAMPRKIQAPIKQQHRYGTFRATLEITKLCG
jgi:hypothetical protein